MGFACWHCAHVWPCEISQKGSRVPVIVHKDLMSPLESTRLPISTMSCRRSGSISYPFGRPDNQVMRQHLVCCYSTVWLAGCPQEQPSTRKAHEKFIKLDQSWIRSEGLSIVIYSLVMLGGIALPASPLLAMQQFPRPRARRQGRWGEWWCLKAQACCCWILASIGMHVTYMLHSQIGQHSL